MTNKDVPFQTRARTIDHLGRGQIADCPVAISELWKNAYDAYARNVSLLIFDGDRPIAAVLDDGVGMSAADFIERWLVVGTESKISDVTAPPPETLGLPLRERQGEKGIGRLSVAFLSPATIVVSKKPGEKFSIILVDWRLFENPFLILDDIRIPVRECETPEQVVGLLPEMAHVILSNLGVEEGDRGARLHQGWKKYSDYEQQSGSGKTTEAQVLAAWQEMGLSLRHLEQWPVFLGLGEHGTALFMLDIHHELAVWVRPDAEDDEAQMVKDRLRQTLTGFTDAYSPHRPDLDYEVLVYEGARNKVILRTADIFSRDDFHQLEHQVDGEFSRDGIFRGRVIVSGRDLGIKEYVPRRPPPQTGRDRLGAFSFCIGTYERDARRSTLTEQQVSRLWEETEKYGGIAFYRDGLRIMPYGRPDSDVFEIEERRNKHAGRQFWAHRRSFGRVSITRIENPNLRDKAGREGLTENRSFRELRILVQGLLVDFAQRYFGTDSEIRQEMMPEIIKANEAARAAAARAKTRRRKNMRVFLKESLPELRSGQAELVTLTRDAEDIKTTKDRERATVMAARFQNLLTLKADLRPPVAPAKLGDLEDKYREYRDEYREFVAAIESFSRTAAEIEGSVGNLSPQETAKHKFLSHQSSLNAKVDSYLKQIDTRLEALKATWRNRGEEDRGSFYKLCRPLLEDDIDALSLIRLLNLIEIQRRELEEGFTAKYAPFIRALDQLAEDIDLDGALTITEDDKSSLEDKVRDLNAVAQIGITVEIVGHELESLDAEVRRNLMRLPETVRQTAAFKLAFSAHHALTEKLRFLSPLKVSGYRAKETISGSQICDYIIEFFGKMFNDNRIIFEATSEFKALKIIDLPSRIYPVFINLVNNAAYWVTHAVERIIKLDVIDGLVIIADSGNGVDQDDVRMLFELFFTRRAGGRGVGLYLCKENLGVSRHTIRYARENDPKILSGANFIIEFRGVIENV